MDERRVSALAEHVEAESLAALFDLASPSVHEALGLEYLRVGGGVAAVANAGPMQRQWSRAVGFGWAEPITDDIVDQVCDLNRRHGAQEVWFQVSPWVRGEWETTLETHGFTPDLTWTKYVRDTSPPPDAFTVLRVRQLTAADAHEYADVYAEGTCADSVNAQVAASVREWALGQFGSSDWKVFGAFDDERMVGCASMYLAGESAEFLGAATIPSARQQGAQSALLVERLRCAARSGCRWVSTEVANTAESGAGAPVGNLRRLGFAALYERRNWVAQLSAA